MSRNETRFCATSMNAKRQVAFIASSNQESKRQSLPLSNYSNMASHVGLNSIKVPTSEESQTEKKGSARSRPVKEQTKLSYSQTMEFNAESYAAKKKLLQQMINALDSARKLKDQELKLKRELSKTNSRSPSRRKPQKRRSIVV